MEFYRLGKDSAGNVNQCTERSLCRYEFEVKVRVHQGSVLSLLLFILLLLWQPCSAMEHSGRKSMQLLSMLTHFQEALDMERSYGGEKVEGKCRKDKDHDLRCRPGPLADFR